MSDTVDMFRDMKEHRKAVRKRYGQLCLRCQIQRPRGNPTILLPGDKCRIDGYQDTRPELTAEQLGAA